MYQFVKPGKKISTKYNIKCYSLLGAASKYIKERRLLKTMQWKRVGPIFGYKTLPPKEPGSIFFSPDVQASNKAQLL